MAKKSNPHPHVAWRDGKPRFQPGKRLRELGHVGRDLRHEDGRWFSKGEAVDWSRAFLAELEGVKAEAKRRGRPVRKPVYTLERLFDDWQNPRVNPKFAVGKPRALSARTVYFYKERARVIAAESPAMWSSVPEASDRAACRALFDRIWSKRGLSTANGALLTLSAAMSWGILRGRVKLTDNPAQRLQMETPEPRVRFGTRAEILALIAAADALGLPAIGDMMLLGVWTGQRQGDRLALAHKGLLNRRRVFRQSKTGAIVAILEAPELEARLKAAMERRRAAAQISTHAVLDERGDVWRPYSDKRYRQDFRAARDEAAKACASVASFHDSDLRDTAVVWMALSQATIPEIVSVTGHTLESATRILRHYLTAHPEMADSAIRKMIAWYEGGGETEVGL